MRTFLTLLLSLVFFTVNAQDENRLNRVKVNLSYSNYQSNAISGRSGDFNRMGNYQLNAIYAFSEIIELGAFGGYSKYSTQNYYNFGINTNIQLLPFILPKLAKRLEFYAIGKVGKTFNENYFGALIGYWEYSGGLGAGIYPFSKKRLGLFAEYTMGKYFFDENRNFKLGLSFRLFKTFIQ